MSEAGWRQVVASSDSCGLQAEATQTGSNHLKSMSCISTAQVGNIKNIVEESAWLMKDADRYILRVLAVVLYLKLVIDTCNLDSILYHLLVLARYVIFYIGIEVLIHRATHDRIVHNFTFARVLSFSHVGFSWIVLKTSLNSWFRGKPSLALWYVDLFFCFCEHVATIQQFQPVLQELFQENLVRGRGLLVRREPELQETCATGSFNIWPHCHASGAMIRAQMASPGFTHVSWIRNGQEGVEIVL